MLVELILAFAGVPASFAILYVRRWQARRTARRNPLTRDLLRSPGESLRIQLNAVSERVTDESLFMNLWPLLVTFSAMFVYSTKGGLTSSRLAIVAVICLGGVLVGGWRLVRCLREREGLRLGLDGECAVGEELNQLLSRGCRVFHDVPGDGGKFNVDHVVVGPSGVWGVETKARSKKGRGADSVRVVYDGQTLQFPGWTTKEPIEQAKRQAAWLEKWLTSAVGEAVSVRPVLALPGWYVKRVSPGGIVVYNGTYPNFHASSNGGSRLDEKMIKRICHQLDQRCRTVVPRAYREP